MGPGERESGMWVLVPCGAFQWGWSMAVAGCSPPCGTRTITAKTAPLFLVNGVVHGACGAKNPRTLIDLLYMHAYSSRFAWLGKGMIEIFLPS